MESRVIRAPVCVSMTMVNRSSSGNAGARLAAVGGGGASVLSAGLIVLLMLWGSCE